MSFLEGPALTFLEKTPSDLPPEFKLMNNIVNYNLKWYKKINFNKKKIKGGFENCLFQSV